MAKHDTTHNRLKPVDLPRLKPGTYHDGGGLYLLVRAAGETPEPPQAIPLPCELPAELNGKLVKARRTEAGTWELIVPKAPASAPSRSWLYRYTRNKKPKSMGLGALHTVSLSEARRKALECRKLLQEGMDPLEAREARRAAQAAPEAPSMSFKQCAEAYIAAHEAGWRNGKHRDQWRNTLRDYANPVFGDLPVGAIDTKLVMQVLQPIWTEKPETASRLRGRIESVLDWAKVQGHRQGENPARWRGHLDKMLPQKTKVRRVEHHTALPYAEMREFMTALRSQEGTGARALEFTILTAARTGEVIGAKWGEINIAEKVWIVPGSRMKAGREHRVPLSDAALAVLGTPGQPDQFAFRGAGRGSPLSNMAMTMALRRMGHGDLTVHGFRSTFMDWATERTNFPAEMRDLALAHTVSDKVEAAYRRGDMFVRRREMMAEWAKFSIE